MASTEIKTLTVGGNSYALNDTTARAGLAAKQDKLTAGSNITISGNTISSTDTTYSAATTSAAGLMSAADKTKLNGIATGANNYTHPTTAGNRHIPAGGSSGQILTWSAAGTAQWGDPSGASYSLPVATSSTLGGVKVGSGLSINSAGVLSATGSGGVTREDAVAFECSLQDGTASTQFVFNGGRNYALARVADGVSAMYVSMSSETLTEHYILFDNASLNSNEVAVIISDITIDGTTADKIIVPSDGITLPKGGYLEMSVAFAKFDTTFYAIITASAKMASQ